MVCIIHTCIEINCRNTCGSVVHRYMYIVYGKFMQMFVKIKTKHQHRFKSRNNVFCEFVARLNLSEYNFLQNSVFQHISQQIEHEISILTSILIAINWQWRNGELHSLSSIVLLARPQLIYLKCPFHSPIVLRGVTIPHSHRYRWCKFFMF